MTKIIEPEHRQLPTKKGVCLLAFPPSLSSIYGNNKPAFIATSLLYLVFFFTLLNWQKTKFFGFFCLHFCRFLKFCKDIRTTRRSHGPRIFALNYVYCTFMWRLSYQTFICPEVNFCRKKTFVFCVEKKNIFFSICHRHKNFPEAFLQKKLKWSRNTCFRTQKRRGYKSLDWPFQFGHNSKLGFWFSGVKLYV